MTETLKRTFHGCLTCRKRKVRCLGGNPCQNCLRMNITCHSSFETNLRIRVSTPNGQKAVDSKHEPSRGVRRVKQSSPPAPSTSTTATTTHTLSSSTSVLDASIGNNDIFVAATGAAASYHPHYPQFTIQPQPCSGFGAASFPNALQYNTPSQGLTVMSHTPPDFDYPLHQLSQHQYPGSATAAWGSSFSDLSAYLDPRLDHNVVFNNSNNSSNSNNNNGIDVSPSPAPVMLPTQQQVMAFNVWIPDTPPLVPSSYPPTSELVPMPMRYKHHLQEGPKEWVPKRRRRNKKGAASSKDQEEGDAGSVEAGVESVNATSDDDGQFQRRRRHHHHHNAYQHVQEGHNGDAWYEDGRYEQVI